MSAVSGLRIRREISFPDVPWERILKIVTSDFGLTPCDAARAIKDFNIRFSRPLNLYWFLSNRLTVADNYLLAALCENQGADLITLRQYRSLWTPAIPVACEQVIEFQPELHRARMDSAPGSFSAVMKLKLFGFHFCINSFAGLFAAQCATFLLAVVFYVLVFGAFLYSFSVFMLFMLLTAEVTTAAISNGTIGLALLSFLVCFAAAFGKVWRDSAGWIFRLFSRRFYNGKPICDESHARRA